MDQGGGDKLTGNGGDMEIRGRKANEVAKLVARESRPDDKFESQKAKAKADKVKPKV